MRSSFRFCFALVSLLVPALVDAQSVQAIRSIGRAQENANEASVAAATAKLSSTITALRTSQALLFQVNKPQLLGYAALLENLERLAVQALDRRDDPKEFVHRLEDFNGALQVFASFRSRAREIARTDTVAKNLIGDLEIATMEAVTRVPPPAIFQYVPSVVFTTGIGVTSRLDDRHSFPISVSTNLLGQLGGAVLSSFGDNAFARYAQDNIVVGAILHAGATGKPSGQLTLGLGEVSAGRATFWPVLGIEQTDTADARVPRSLVSEHPTTGTWSTPILGVAFIWGDLKKQVEVIKRGGLRPIFSAGVRFPYYYPGGTLDALSALFADRISNYDRASHEQYFVSVDIPLLKVDPSRILPGR